MSTSRTSRLPRHCGGGRVNLRRANRPGDIMTVDRDHAIADSQSRAARHRRPSPASSARSIPLLKRLPRHRAVHRARIDVLVPQAFGHGPRDRAFACARGSVDGDDQAPGLGESGSRDSGAGVTLLLSSAMRFQSRAAILVGLTSCSLLACVFHRSGTTTSVAQRSSSRPPGMQGVARTLADWEAHEVVEERAHDSLARRRAPRDASTCLAGCAAPGVPAGPGRACLGGGRAAARGFARDLASMGHPVVTAGPPDLARYTITPEATDVIEDAAAWLSAQRDLAPDGRIGMMGISFAGGLSIVAAGRPALRRTRSRRCCRLAGTAICRARCATSAPASQPDGSLRPPHDYGVVIILLGVADRRVPATGGAAANRPC